MFIAIRVHMFVDNSSQFSNEVRYSILLMRMNSMMFRAKLMLTATVAM